MLHLWLCLVPVFPDDAAGGYSDDEGGGFECPTTPMGEKSATSQKVGFRRIVQSLSSLW